MTIDKQSASSGDALRRAPKLMRLSDAAALVDPGATVGFGGLIQQNKPCAFVRELVRRRVGDLTVAPPAASSYDVDLLVGAGLVRRVRCPAVYFEDLGLAPSFRRAAEQGLIEIEEVDEAIVLGGLLAVLSHAPYHVVTSMTGSQIPDDAPNAEPTIIDGHPAWLVRPAAPDVAVIHVQIADPYGNVRHAGATYADVLLAKTAATTIVTADELVDRLVIDQAIQAPLAAHHVNAVVHTPEGAWPAASHGRYLADNAHLAEYVMAAGDPARLLNYIDLHVSGRADKDRSGMAELTP